MFLGRVSSPKLLKKKKKKKWQHFHSLIKKKKNKPTEEKTIPELMAVTQTNFNNPQPADAFRPGGSTESTHWQLFRPLRLINTRYELIIIINPIHSRPSSFRHDVTTRTSPFKSINTAAKQLLRTIPSIGGI